MANVTSGTKRRADDNLESEQRLSKRFDLLNLDHSGKLWVSASSLATSTHAQYEKEEPVDYMRVEDTKNRVYIHNLDEELADIVADEPKMIFLPDIEKHFSQIPKHVLKGEQSHHPSGTEMILYTVPSSLSVPPEQDSVRKAIIETRARAREKAVQNSTNAASRDALLHDEMVVDAVPTNGQPNTADGYVDTDAMEIE